MATSLSRCTEDDPVPTQLDMMTDLTGDASAATFSPCRTYRYTLRRTWDPAKPCIVFLMLNPSTADEVQNDPTVERCHRRAIRMGAGGVVVVNLFALRSTDPSALYGHPDPVGPANDASIVDECSKAGMVIAAWGTHGKHLGRAEAVLALLAAAGVKLHALAVNADGSPKHPLYIANNAEPLPYPPGRAESPPDSQDAGLGQYDPVAPTH